MFKGVSTDSIVGVGGGVDDGVSTCVDSNLNTGDGNGVRAGVWSRQGCGKDACESVGGGVGESAGEFVGIGEGWGVAPRSGRETAPAPDLAWAWVSALV